MMKKLKHFIGKRKMLVLALVAVIGAGIYLATKFFAQEKAPVQYVNSTVQKGTLVTSVSGSGQISVSSQVDVKAKSSGEILSIFAKNGQEVKSGATLVQLDARDAVKSVRDAQTNLESAQLSLQKLKSSITASSISQAQNAVVSAKNSLEKLKLSQEISYQKSQESKQNAEDTLLKSYEDTLSTVSDVFLDLPTITTGLHDALYSETIGMAEVTVGNNETNSSALINNTESSYRDQILSFQTSAENDYQTARTHYNENFDNYKAVNRSSSQSQIEALLTETIETTKLLAEATKSELNYFDSWVDYRTKKNLPLFSSVTTYQTQLGNYLGEINSHYSSLLSLQRTLKESRESIVNAERDLKQMDQNNPLDIVAAEATVHEKEDALEKLKEGVDPLDIRTQEITIEQRRIALSDAQGKLADYAVRAPFDGIVAKIDLRKGDTLSSGGTVATLITQQKIAEISLNEVDVAKIKVGQKVTLTFDAIENLSISGQVGEIDALGTVNQGVVSYNVKILFDTQDDRIKQGMSLSATIVTDVKTDVLMIENSAIKTQGNTSYVEIVDSAHPDLAPTQQSVVVGMANDTHTEIISGLKEGDQVVVRTITPTTKTATTSQAPSLLGGTGNRAFGQTGGGFRP